jgi:hypothetical protein
MIAVELAHDPHPPIHRSELLAHHRAMGDEQRLIEAAHLKVKGDESRGRARRPLGEVS